jgi:micrococcal nuclease
MGCTMKFRSLGSVLFICVLAPTLLVSVLSGRISIAQNCDPAYPDEDVCIPSPPPDLDCGEISYRNFTVEEPDPHNFDGDDDGVGCESTR